MRQGVYSAVLAVACTPAMATELAESLWRQDAGRYGYCAGGYVEANTAPTVDSQHGIGAVDLSAGSLTARIGETTIVSGGVVVRQGNRILRAPQVVIDEQAGTATASAAARIGQPGLQLFGEQATMSLAGDRAEVMQAEFVLGELQMHGEAAKVRKQGERLRLTATWLTRCPPTDRTWRLSAASIDLDDATLAARHVRLAVGKLPIFYAPYLRFAARDERASGFLLPNLGYDEHGLDLTAPYYLNLAPNYDATVTPRLITERGAGFEAQFRHMSRATASQLDGAMLFADDDYDGQLPRRDALATGGVFSPADRWLLDAEHRGRWQRLSTRIDYSAVSDDDYFVDLGSDVGVASRALLERRGEVEYVHGGLLVRLWAQGFQRLEPGLEPYRRLPEANLVYSGQLRKPLAWSLATSWSSFDRSTAVATQGLAAVTGQRLHVEPRLRLPLWRPWGFVTLGAGWRHTRYDLAGVPSGLERKPQRDIRWANVDGGLFFERELPTASLVQTLEPRLYYLYQSHAEQSALPRFDAARLTFGYRQLFRDNRFAGVDRFGDANQISGGVTSRLLAATGKERLSASLGAIVYFDDRQVVLRGQPGADQVQPSSALAGELATTWGALRVASTLAWDANDNDIDEATLRIAYRPGERRIVNVALRSRAGGASEQTDASFHWPLGRQWSAFGRWNHDWRHGQIIEGFAGVGYASCCLDAKLLWHRTVAAYGNRPTPEADWNSGVLLQVVFRGLAGFGTKVDSRLMRGIKGFQGAQIR